MTTKKCSSGASCLHPNGPELPATAEFFVPRKLKTQMGYSSKCRPCFYEANRLSRLKHIERAKAYEKERNKRYYSENRDAELRRVAERRRSDPQRAKEHDRKSKQRRSPESIAKDRARTKAWCKKNPEKLRVYSQRRYARKMGAEGIFTVQDVELQYRSQKGLCWWCGESLDPDDYHIDHRIALDRGGTNWPNNICISCPRCNLSKGRKLPHEWNGRLL